MKFLDEQHLEHGPMRRTSEYPGLCCAYGDVPMVRAIKRRTWRSLLMFESIQIVFIFDEDGRALKGSTCIQSTRARRRIAAKLASCTCGFGKFQLSGSCLSLMFSLAGNCD